MREAARAQRRHAADHRHRNLMEEPANDEFKLLRDKILPRTTLMSNSRWL